MELIICEKPSVAKQFSIIFQNHFKTRFVYENNYYSNGKIIIAAARGHLCELSEPAAYNPDYKSWQLHHLPIIPNTFKLKVSKDKTKLFNHLKSLISKATVIYNATDAGREGELIFRYILKLSNYKNNTLIKRIWADDTEEKTIVNSYLNAKDQTAYDNLYLAAKARNESDWVIGINATRALTVGSKSNKMLSLGRVQTAILRLIVDRYNSFKNFTKENLYTPSISIKDAKLRLNTNFKNETEAEEIINNTPSKVNLKKDTKQSFVKQPLLFSLPDLQIEISKTFGYSATKTLEIAQSLYENKYISYPRTDSNYLNESQKETIYLTLKHFIGQNISFNNHSLKTADFLVKDKLFNHFIFNDKKTSDHYAIIPLKTNYSNLSLSKEHMNVYDFIIKRFFQNFMHSPLIEYTTYSVDIGLNKYVLKGKTIIKKGFLVLDSISDEFLPNLTETTYDVLDKTIEIGSTQPLKPFTESTLLKAMKNPLRYQQIEENKDAIKSLGTPATNDKYLPLLINRTYVSFDKKYIIPTKLGVELIKSLSGTKITSIALTADIEHQINKINKGELDYILFMNAISKYTDSLISEIKLVAPKIGLQVVDTTPQYKCPKCKTGKLYLSKNKKNFYCSNYNNTDNPCNFFLNTNVAGTKLSPKALRSLLDMKPTPELNFTSKKTNAKYKASIYLDKNFKTQFKFKN